MFTGQKDGAHFLSKSQEVTEDGKDGEKEKQREANKSSVDTSSPPVEAVAASMAGSEGGPDILVVEMSC